MKETNLQRDMSGQIESKVLLNQAKQYAFDYLDQVSTMDAVPSVEALRALAFFNEPMPADSQSPTALLELLQAKGSKAISAQGGGRYFGFVNGGILPVSLAARWMADTWDQNSALYVMSPLTSKLEELCEIWLTDLLGLPLGTAAGFVSGSTTAILCALATARNELLKRQGWDVHAKGLWGAPPIRVVLGAQAHSSVFKVLSLLGFGKDCVVTAPVDAQGRMLADNLPALDNHTLLIVQAGNVNSGAFDPIDALCDLAVKAGAWVHVDGAFGLWANACNARKHLTIGLERADSWSADAHKTLNAPYDCGIVFCKHRAALASAMQASGSYIQYSEQRDNMLYTPEMSRRARCVELWAALKYLGKSGVDTLVETLCSNAQYFAEQLSLRGFRILNDVVYNQVLVACVSPEETKSTLQSLQSGGVCWCGGAVWDGEPVIRISVCSWRTTEADIDASVIAFDDARKHANISLT